MSSIRYKQNIKKHKNDNIKQSKNSKKIKHYQRYCMEYKKTLQLNCRKLKLFINQLKIRTMRNLNKVRIPKRLSVTRSRVWNEKRRYS